MSPIPASAAFSEFVGSLTMRRPEGRAPHEPTTCGYATERPAFGFDLTWAPPVAKTSPIYAAHHPTCVESALAIALHSGAFMSKATPPKYRRILLKLSGEALG